MMQHMKPDKDTVAISKKLSKQVLSAYKPDSPVLKKVSKVLKDNNNFILTTHIGADADGIGSQIGLYYLLKKLKKNVRIINNEKPPAYLDFMIPEGLLESIEDLDSEDNQFISELARSYVLILDSSELKRSGRVAEALQKAGSKWATIDHHVLPKKKNYFVDATYGATAEFIWDIYKYMNINITPDAALPLYAGIVADTGNFRYPKSSMRLHLAAGELISLGVHSDDVYRRLYESQPPDRLLYLKRILNNAIINADLGYVAGEVKKNTHRGLHLGDSASEGIVNMLLAVKGIKIAALMTKTSEGYLKCSLRSVGEYDVAAIAREFNGGGHRNAAGLKVEEPYRKVKKRLLKAIENTLSA